MIRQKRRQIIIGLIMEMYLRIIDIFLVMAPVLRGGQLVRVKREAVIRPLGQVGGRMNLGIIIIVKDSII